MQLPNLQLLIHSTTFWWGLATVETKVKDDQEDEEEEAEAPEFSPTIVPPLSASGTFFISGQLNFAVGICTLVAHESFVGIFALVWITSLKRPQLSFALTSTCMLRESGVYIAVFHLDLQVANRRGTLYFCLCFFCSLRYNCSRWNTIKDYKLEMKKREQEE